MNKGELTIIEGDATEPQTVYKNEIVVIAHMCNNENIWGGGFVVALSKKWPEPEKMYRAFVNGESPYPEKWKTTPTLGQTCYAKINNHLVVANMIAQNSIVSEDNPKFVLILSEAAPTTLGSSIKDHVLLTIL